MGCNPHEELPDTIDGEHDKDLVFHSSGALAAGLQSHCIRIIQCLQGRQHPPPPRLLVHSRLNEIYQFLVANGKCSAILGVARRHDLLQHTAMLLADITRRSPRQSARGKGQDERFKTAKTTEVEKRVWERCEPISENVWYYDRSR